MKNKITKYDFLIVGAGLVGSIAAIALTQKNFKVLVVEQNKSLPKDNRTLAVNANSRDFLKTLNLWPSDKGFHEDIDEIIIKDFINSNNLSFQDNQESLGSVIFNKQLLLTTRKLLQKKYLIKKGVNFQSNNIQPKKKIIINNKFYSFKKIIIATGKNFIDKELIKKINFNSNHRAHVGFFYHQKNHYQKAYEIFTQNGPLAVLPSPNKHKNKSTFIFSTRREVNYKFINSLLNKQFRGTHGRIDLQKTITSFPILPQINSVLKADYLLIGDAFRTIHPVAGQGWNLGIKDVQCLCNTLDEFSIDDKKFDSLFFSRRQIENLSYLSFTSGINFLYENESFITSQVIKSGFLLLRKFDYLKNIFIKQAMGRVSLI